jgi:hypothetical protein
VTACVLGGFAQAHEGVDVGYGDYRATADDGLLWWWVGQHFGCVVIRD